MTAVLDPQRPAVMPIETALAVKARACDRKRIYRSARSAKAAAERLNGSGNAGASPVVIYRCSFTNSGGRHWHVGHAMSPESMADLAQAIRTLHSPPKATEAS